MFPINLPMKLSLREKAARQLRRGTEETERELTHGN